MTLVLFKMGSSFEHLLLNLLCVIFLRLVICHMSARKLASHPHADQLLAVDVHGTGTANALTAGTSECQRGVYLAALEFGSESVSLEHFWAYTFTTLNCSAPAPNSLLLIFDLAHLRS